MKKFALLIVFLILSLNFSSCISVSRNIKVNKDGSGSEFVIVNFDKTFFDIMTSLATISDSSKTSQVRDSLYNDDDFVRSFKEKLAAIPGLTLKEIYSSTNPDSSKTMYVSYDFDRIGLLAISIGDNKNEVISEDITVTYEDLGDKIQFSYNQRDPESEVEKDSTYASIMEGVAETFKGKEAVYNIEFSYDIESTNAQIRDGRLLKWSYPMDELILNGNKVNLEALLKKD
jgi:hypothetical protein